jgi:hypothetical protein
MEKRAFSARRRAGGAAAGLVALSLLTVGAPAAHAQGANLGPTYLGPGRTAYFQHGGWLERNRYLYLPPADVSRPGAGDLAYGQQYEDQQDNPGNAFGAWGAGSQTGPNPAALPAYPPGADAPAFFTAGPLAGYPSFAAIGAPPFGGSGVVSSYGPWMSYGFTPGGAYGVTIGSGWASYLQDPYPLYLQSRSTGGGYGTPLASSSRPVPAEPPVTRASLAYVTLAITPGDASLYLDGNPIGSASSFARRGALLLVPAGSYRLEAWSRDDRLLALDLEVRPGQSVKIQRKLEPLGSPRASGDLPSERDGG